MSHVIHLGARRASLALVLALVVLGAGLPARALAGQIVYTAGTGIWAMNEDGSGKHELVDATQVPGMEYLGDPDVQPNGNEVAFVGRWNQSSVEQNKYYGASPGFCGGNCEGYYELRNGSVTRISPAPFDCGGQPCASYEYDPRVASDGSVGYVFQTWVSEANGYGWSPILGQSALLSRDANGSGQQQWKTVCEGTSSANQEVTDADVLAVDPVNPNEIVYGNCAETSYANGCDLGYVDAYDVYLSGANRSDPSDDVLVRRVTDPNAACLQDATTRIQDLSFSPDGSHIVEVHGSSGAGIWTYPAAANATATQLIAITGDWIFYAARYVGSNKIAFTAGEDTNHDGSPEHIDLYEIPTSCTPQTCAIASGQGVTNLTRSGDLTYDYILNRGSFAYTSSTTPLVAVPTAGGSGGNGGTGGSAGGGTQGGHGGNGGAAKAPGATITVARTQRLAVLAKKGLTFTFSCARACRAKASLILAGKTAVKLHLEKVARHKKPKSLVVATVTKRLTKAGKLKVTVHLSRKVISKLRHARSVTVTLKLLVTGSSGGSRTLTKTIHIKR